MVEARRSSRRSGDGTERLWEVIEAGIALSGELDLDTVLRRIVLAACRVVDAEYGALGVLDPEGRGLSNFVYHGISKADAERIGPLPVGHGLLGALIEDPHPICLEHIDHDPRSSGFPEHHPKMDSFLGVPIVSRGRVFGNLYLTEKRGGPFTPEDEEIAKALASQAGVAVENARLYREAKQSEESATRRLQTLSSVQEVGAALLRERDPATVLETIVAQASSLVDAETALIAMVSGGDTFEIEVTVGRRADEVRGRRFPIAGSLSGRTLMTQYPALIEDAATDDRGRGPISSALDARSAIFAPLVESGESMGVLAVLHREPNRFGQEELFILRHFADLASLALRNARYLAEVQERARVEGELEASRVREEMRSELLRRVIRAQEDERRRVSRDLHDSAGQALTSILLGLKVVEQEKTLPEARARVADLREIASEAAGELRRLALELRPTVLDDLGLEAAAERYLRDFRERSGTTVRARLELGERRLDPEVETVVYRVLQESLTNIAKYAEAKTVNVALTFDGRILKLRVRDDGRGFDPGTVTGGLGLRGMQERADLVHGKVDVTSVPGGGTSVELAIPDVTEAMS